MPSKSSLPAASRRGNSCAPSGYRKGRRCEMSACWLSIASCGNDLRRGGGLFDTALIRRATFVLRSGGGELARFLPKLSAVSPSRSVRVIGCCVSSIDRNPLPRVAGVRVWSSGRTVSQEQLLGGLDELRPGVAHPAARVTAWPRSGRRPDRHPRPMCYSSNANSKRQRLSFANQGSSSSRK